MTLVSRLGKFFGYVRAPDRGDVALGLADEVIIQTKSVREQLGPFAKMENPIRTIFHRKRVAERFETEAELRTPRAH